MTEKWLLAPLTIAGGILILYFGNFDDLEQSHSGTSTPLEPAKKLTAGPRPSKPILKGLPGLAQTRLPATAGAEVTQLPRPVSLTPSVRGNRFIMHGIHRFGSAEILAFEDSVPNHQGIFTRNSLLETHGRFGVISVLERLQFDPQSGADRLLDRQERIGNRIILPVEPGRTRASLERLGSELGFKLIRKLSESAYLAEFDRHDVHALDELVEQLRARGVNATPDFIRHTGVFKP